MFFPFKLVSMRFVKNNFPVKCDKLLSFWGGKLLYLNFMKKMPSHWTTYLSIFSNIVLLHPCNVGTEHYRLVHGRYQSVIRSDLCVLERICDNYHPTSESPFRYPASPRSRGKLITNIALNEPGVTCTLKEIPLKDVNCTPPPPPPKNFFIKVNFPY